LSEPDRFLLLLLNSRSDLKLKAQIMLQLGEVGPNLQDLLAQIDKWHECLRRLQQEETMLHLVIQATLHLGRVLNQSNQTESFDLQCLQTLFTMRTVKRKPAWHFLLKQIIAQQGWTWFDVPPLLSESIDVKALLS
jgi:hypothetical protein